MEENRRSHVFSEDEVGQILKRAAEMQGDTLGKPSFGLTLGELEQLARDADIDPRFISAAALELTGGAEGNREDSSEGLLTMTLKRRIEGSVSEKAWENMVSRARKRFKKSGVTDERGNTREWTADSKSTGAASISLHDRGDHTQLEVFWHEEMLPVPFFVIPLVLSLISLPILFEEFALSGGAGAAIWLVIVTTLVTISRTAFKAVANGERRKIVEYTDSLVALNEEERAHAAIAAENAQRSAASSRSELESPHPGGQIDLDDDANEEINSPRSRRRERN